MSQGNLIRSQSLPGDALELRGAGCAALGVRAQGRGLQPVPMLRRAVRSCRAPGRHVGQRQPRATDPNRRNWTQTAEWG